MEKQFKLDFNGQQVQQQDFADIGETGGLADDRVFAELFRLAPYDGSTVSRGILRYIYAGASGSVGTVAPNGATGQIKVKPFRAVLGSRTTAGTEARKNWRDIRSGLSIAEGATSTDTLVTLSANSSGNPRWDLIYAAITPDANGASTTRKVKDATTRVVTPQSVVPNLITTVAIGSVTGTPGASPSFPATPTDSAGTYYIPLAYVRVPNGFGSSSTVLTTDIDDIAPVLMVSPAVGASRCRPANQQSKAGGAAISGTGTTTDNGLVAWGATSGHRPAVYMPPSMAGKEEILIAMDLFHASSTNWTHQDGSLVDDSIDWRNRLFKWTAMIATSGGSNCIFPWQSPVAGFPPIPGAFTVSTLDTNFASTAHQIGFGQSFTYDIAVGKATVATLVSGSNVPNTIMAGSTAVKLYTDLTSGALRVAITGAPGAVFFIWLEASAQYAGL